MASANDEEIAPANFYFEVGRGAIEKIAADGEAVRQDFLTQQSRHIKKDAATNHFLFGLFDAAFSCAERR